MGLFASLGAASLLALNATAETPVPVSTTTPTAAPADAAPAKLPYGVEDVLKLSRAQVSEDVTLNFIRNSGTIYNLAPKDIVYLRNEGVSDRVINTMIDQRKSVPAEAAAQAATTSASSAPSAPATSVATVAAAPQYAPTYVQPVPVYAQPEPPRAPSSSLYVIPYPYAGYRYPGPYPYSYFYGDYYRYYGPSVVYTIGYGNGGYCGGYYGVRPRYGPYRCYR